MQDMVVPLGRACVVWPASPPSEVVLFAEKQAPPCSVVFGDDTPSYVSEAMEHGKGAMNADLSRGMPCSLVAVRVVWLALLTS